MERIRRSEDIFKRSDGEINTLRQALHEAELKKAETNYSMENLKQRIRDVYKLDLDEVRVEEGWQEIERSQLKSEVEEKRAKLDAMGSVNLVAIEEHTELQERYAFLTHQRDDLLTAKDSLMKAIAKINKTTKELFIETFRNIQVEFRNFFKMLLYEIFSIRFISSKNKIYVSHSCSGPWFYWISQFKSLIQWKNFSSSMVSQLFSVKAAEQKLSAFS